MIKVERTFIIDQRSMMINDQRLTIRIAIRIRIRIRIAIRTVNQRATIKYRSSI